jgi:CRP-like cAMP-binding protein
MAGIDQSTVRNQLLKRLSGEVFLLVAPHLTWIDLPLRHVLVEANQPTPHVCFIESGLASMVISSEDHETVEVGHIGREGMTGEHLAMMTDKTPTKTFLQIAGTGYLMPAGEFLKLLGQDPATRHLILRYSQSSRLQLAYTALANARYSVYERLARWLLMVHDRVDGDDLHLTHEFLSLMLGVRRSGVTDQVHLLEGIHAIKATRGLIRVLDRPKLEQIAGGSYGTPEREHERLLAIQS